MSTPVLEGFAVFSQHTCSLLTPAWVPGSAWKKVCWSVIPNSPRCLRLPQGPEPSTASTQAREEPSSWEGWYWGRALPQSQSRGQGERRSQQQSVSVCWGQRHEWNKAVGTSGGTASRARTEAKLRCAGREAWGLSCAPSALPQASLFRSFYVKRVQSKA